MLRLVFSENEEEWQYAKTYQITMNQYGNKFYFAYNEEWTLRDVTGTNEQLMSNEHYKSYIVRYPINKRGDRIKLLHWHMAGLPMLQHLE